MIAFPAGVKVWIAGGFTNLRCGMNRLALKVQQGLGRIVKRSEDVTETLDVMRRQWKVIQRLRKKHLS